MPLVTLITDFGTKDPYAGEVKGAIYSACPSCTVVDITHEINPYDVLSAGHMLNKIRKSFPKNCVHLCAVGSAAKNILVKSRGQLFLAPDNGVLTRVLGQNRAEVFALELKVKNTFFQGRDVLAPLAGRLAAGQSLAEMARPETTPVILPQAKPQWRLKKREIQGRVMVIDRFGNVETNIPASMLAHLKNPEVRWRDRIIPRFYKNFQTMVPHRAAAIVNCYGYMELVMPQESLAEAWGLMAGERLVVREKG